MPWRHFVALLQPPEKEEDLEAYLGMRFSQLLEAMFASALDNNDEKTAKQGMPSFNILMTKRSLHVIPRRHESFDMREAGWDAYSDADAVPEKTGTLSINALGMSYISTHDYRICWYASDLSPCRVGNLMQGRPASYLAGVNTHGRAFLSDLSLTLGVC